MRRQSPRRSAGCLGESDPTGDDGGDERSAPYRNWLVTDDEDDLDVAYVDWDGLEDIEAADREADPDGTGTEPPDDAGPLANEEDLLLAAPLVGMVFVALGGLGTLRTGLEGVVGNDGFGAMGGGVTGTDGEDGEASEEDVERFETSVDDVFWVNDAYV